MNPPKRDPESSILWELSPPCKADQITQCPDQGSTHSSHGGISDWDSPIVWHSQPLPKEMPVLSPCYKGVPQPVLFCTLCSLAQLIANETDPQGPICELARDL